MKNKRGFIINDRFKYVSPKIGTEESGGGVKIELDLPEKLKILQSEILEDQFILKIDRKDLDMSILGKYTVVVMYEFSGTTRNVYKNLVLNIISIDLGKTTKSLKNQKTLEAGGDSTFDGVESSKIVSAVERKNNPSPDGEKAKPMKA